jgi:ESCRT-II complex subunit VPS25
MTSSDFAFPDFFDYPPYFTVQPTPETFRKQRELWKSLVLRCARASAWAPHSSSSRLISSRARPRVSAVLLSSPLPDDRSTHARALARARRYCAHHALFVLNLDDVSLPLFDNPNVKVRSISRRSPYDRVGVVNADP